MSEYSDKVEPDNGISPITLVLVGFLFLPAGVTAFTFYMLLRKWHMRISAIFQIFLIFQLFLVLLWTLLSPLSKFKHVILHLTQLRSNWTELLPGLTIIYMAIGACAGLFFAWWEIKQMRTNPHRLKLPGSWAYQFKFRRTFWEMRKRNKNVAALKSGITVDDDRVPIGLDEENGDSIVYRYYDEAARHTLVSGQTGSGKALAKDTLIPTPNGMSTVDKLQPGDTIFDETGKPTKILAKYQPLTSDHYKITFSDGNTIDTCGDHLWEVESLNKYPNLPIRLPLIFNEENEKKILSCKSPSEDVTLFDLKRVYDVKITSTVRKLLSTLTPTASPDTGEYSTGDLLKVLKNTNRNISETVKNSWIKYLESITKEYTTRSDLLAIANEPLWLTHFARHIKKNITKVKRYNLIDVSELLLKENAKRKLAYTVKRGPWAIELLSTRSMKASGVKNKAGRSNFAVPVVTNAIEYEEKDFVVHPYTLGAWLGDDSSASGNICGADVEIKDYIESHSKYKVAREWITEASDNRQKVYSWRFNGLREDLNSLGVLKKQGDTGFTLKDIPDEYLLGSIDQRIELLAGLLDTDGCASKSGAVEIGLTVESIITKARVIVQSLGWKTTKIYSKTSHAVAKNGTRIAGKRVYSFSFYPDKQVFRLSRKAERLQHRLESKIQQQSRHKRRYIRAIEPIEAKKEDYYCFTVDAPSHLFLCTEAFIPTHNSLFTLLPLIRGDIENRLPTVIIDFKRDPELAAKVATWTKEAGSNFYHFANGAPAEYDIPNSPGQCTYDPLAGATTSAKADMVLGMREYDQASAVYKSAMQQLLQVMFGLISAADPKQFPSDTKLRWNEGSLFQLASIASGMGFTDLVNACQDADPEIYKSGEEIKYALEGKTQIRHAMDELAGQVRTIVASEYGRWMKTIQGERSIDLYNLTREKGNVILFSLNSDSEPDFARYVGSLILADITNTSARRRNAGLDNRVQVYIDEFQIVPPASVAGLLEKSRASAIALTLAQQSFEQIVSSASSNGEAYLLSILDTCGNFIIHSGSTQDSAERLSKILGKHWITKYRSTNKNESFFLSFNWKNKRDSVINTSEEETWVFQPREFLTLTNSNKDDKTSRATAILINKTSFDEKFSSTKGATARHVWLVPRSDIFDRNYIPGQTPAISHAPTDDQLKTTVNKEANDWEEIKPNDYNPLAEPILTVQDEAFISSPQGRAEQAVDDDDGAFDFIKVDETDELLTYTQELHSRSEAPKTVPEVKSKPSFNMEAWGENAPPSKTTPTQEKARNSPPPQKNAPKPISKDRPSGAGGLPIPPPAKASSPEDAPSELEEEEFTLPDL